MGSERRADVQETVHVEVARYGDRDALIEVLRAHGYEPRAVEEDGAIGVEIPCGGDAQRLCDDLLGELESLVAELDAPLVPVLAEHAVFLRPPAD